MGLLCEFAERRKFYTEYVPFWASVGIRIQEYVHSVCGIRPEYCEYGQNTAPWEVVWNTWNTYSHSRVKAQGRGLTGAGGTEKTGAKHRTRQDWRALALTYHNLNWVHTHDSSKNFPTLSQQANNYSKHGAVWRAHAGHWH